MGALLYWGSRCGRVETRHWIPFTTIWNVWLQRQLACAPNTIVLRHKKMESTRTTSAWLFRLMPEELRLGLLPRGCNARRITPALCRKMSFSRAVRRGTLLIAAHYLISEESDRIRPPQMGLCILTWSRLVHFQVAIRVGGADAKLHYLREKGAIDDNLMMAAIRQVTAAANLLVHGSSLKGDQMRVFRTGAKFVTASLARSITTLDKQDPHG